VTPFAILFTLAAIGIAETAYLIRKRKENEKPVCPIGGGCATVLESKYNVTLGIHNDELGLAFYVAMAGVTALLVIGTGPLAAWNLLAAGMIVGALLMSARFVYLQWQVIRAWCFWCLMSTATIVGMALILSANGFDLAFR
jgi:uncharacterized membrane protein